jgi:hypothetical protein
MAAVAREPHELPMSDSDTPETARRARVPWLASSVLEEGFVRRTKSLLRTAPIHRMAQTSGRQDWDAELYDPRVLAMAAIDAVISRMGLSSELTSPDLIVVLSELAQAMAPGRPEVEYAKVATFVVEGLLNDRDQNGSEAFALPYSDFHAGPHARRELRFFLLTEKLRAGGQVVLEASVDAVNVFRGSLAMSVEDAQTAVEHVMELQIARGDLNEAEISAEQNLRLTLEKRAKIQSLLEAARSDVSRVDWAGDVLGVLDTARTHVHERMIVEGRMLAHLTAGDGADDPEVRATAARVAHLLDSCLSAHRELHGQLMGANDVFLAEQQRQQLRYRGHGVGLFSLTDHLVEPLLFQPVSVGDAVGTAFVEQVLGAAAPRLPRLCDLVDMLLRVPTAPVEPPSPEEEPDFSDSDVDVEFYDPDVVEAASLILEATRQAPVRLSTLLADAAGWGTDVAELLRLSVLWSFAPEYAEDAIGLALDLIDPGVVVVPAAEPFALEGWAGDDLLVGPVELLVGADDEEEAHKDGFKEPSDELVKVVR